MRNTITIYLPQKHQENNILERLRALAKQHDRSVNYLAVRAILEYLEREEQESAKK